MSNWNIGDDALCIKIGNWSYDFTYDGELPSGPTPGPGLGQTYKVVDVYYHADTKELYLEVSSFPNELFRAARFVKLLPPEDIEDQETLYIKDLESV